MSAQEQFERFWRRIDARGDFVPVYELLHAKYSDPRRAYHNLKHITDCLEEFECIRERCDDVDSVEFAIWFHDAVYDAKAKDNEEQSASLARRICGDAGLSLEFGERVYALILATKHAAEPRGNDAQIMVDVDLSILGQSEATFDKYERNIRAEYTWVPEAQFRSGRAKILEGFLKRKRIYSTDYFFEKYETPARVNLTRSLEKLRA